MDFFKKTTGLVSIFLISTLLVLWSVGNLVFSKLFFSSRRNPATDRLLSGCKGAGKTVGFALLFFGNVGLYYFSEKSIACMLTFLFLAVYCLCTLLCIQPYTDFGTQEFLFSASLNQALRLFGLRSLHSLLVIVACVVIAGVRYFLEPVHPFRGLIEAIDDEVQLESGPHEEEASSDVEVQLEESGQVLPVSHEEESLLPLWAQLGNELSPFKGFLELIGCRKKKVLESLVKSRLGVHSEELFPLSPNFHRSFPSEMYQFTCPL